MVCFRTTRGRFALPVESTVSITTMDGIVDLPSPRADVVGLLPRDPPLSVLATLGDGGDQVVVVAADGVRYGLRVLEVLAVRRLDEVPGPPPRGQHEGLIAGTLGEADDLVLIADARALAARL